MPAVKTKRISPEAYVAICSAEMDGNIVSLTCGQLQPKVYKEVKEALLSIGCAWNKKLKTHVCESDAQDSLDMLIQTGEFVRGADVKQQFGEFFTPDDLADEVVRLAQIPGGGSLLEPSAGSGQLLRAIERAHGTHHIDCYAIEIQQRHAESLKAISSLSGATVADFLTCDPSGFNPFDAVLMNPPFARQADVDHVLHAWNFLAPGGRLTAIMSTSWTFRQNKKSIAFREWLEKHDGQIHANPEGSFKVSGTNVNTVTIVVDK